MKRCQTLYQIQDQWDSEHDRRQIRFARHVVRQQKANIGNDIVTMFLFAAVFVFIYFITP